MNWLKSNLWYNIDFNNQSLSRTRREEKRRVSPNPKVLPKNYQRKARRNKSWPRKIQKYLHLQQIKKNQLSWPWHTCPLVKIVQTLTINFPQDVMSKINLRRRKLACLKKIIKMSSSRVGWQFSQLTWITLNLQLTALINQIPPARAN